MLVCAVRRRPGGTRFPYTTLFRSVRSPAGERPRPGRVSRRPRPRHGGARGADHGGAREVRVLHHQGDRRPEVRDHWPDRKSTRLNSSHVKISYAVFCLKKKTGSPSRALNHACLRRAASAGRYSLSLHDALPICPKPGRRAAAPGPSLAPASPPPRRSARRGSWGGAGSTCTASSRRPTSRGSGPLARSEEHTSELQSRENLVCRLLLEKKNRLA